MTKKNRIIGTGVLAASLLIAGFNAPKARAFTGNDPIIIQIGNNNLEVRERLLNLERAVSELQNRVLWLESQSARPVSRNWDCSISDSFGKTFLGQGRSQVSAEADARQKCGDSTGDMFCKGAVKCQIEN